MKIRHLFLLCLIAISATLSANGKTVIPITTDDISLIYKVDDKNGRLYQSYLGQKLSFDSDIVQLPLGNEAYLTHGMEDYFEPAIRVLHNDGNPSLLLKYISHENKQLQPEVVPFGDFIVSCFCCLLHRLSVSAGKRVQSRAA